MNRSIDYVDISPSGAVVLSRELTCDGFVHSAEYRVQTHIHDDHMTGFTNSKGYQTLLMSQATKTLLEFEFNADIAYRENIKAVPMDEKYALSTGSVTLRESGHMLGAVQVEHELENGVKVGYSGDFAWPMENPMQVDVLVVDSTYGTPRKVREYSQAFAEQALINLIFELHKKGPIHIKAHRGTISRALQLISIETEIPVLGSPTRCKEARVYADLGYSIRPLIDIYSPEGLSASKESHIQVYSKGDQMPVDYVGSSIILSAFLARPDNPITEYSKCSWAVALTNHADFEGTLSYIQATGAKQVLVDNHRGGHEVPPDFDPVAMRDLVVGLGWLRCFA